MEYTYVQGFFTQKHKKIYLELNAWTWYILSLQIYSLPFSLLLCFRKQISGTYQKQSFPLALSQVWPVGSSGKKSESRKRKQACLFSRASPCWPFLFRQRLCFLVYSHSYCRRPSGATSVLRVPEKLLLSLALKVQGDNYFSVYFITLWWGPFAAIPLYTPFVKLLSINLLTVPFVTCKKQD